MKRPPSTRGKYDRAQPAKARKAAQREALLDSATTAIARLGFAHASVEAIVDQARMSRRTFYEHFDDLRDVLHQIHDRAANFAFTMIETQLSAEADPLEQIRSGIRSYLGAIAANPEVAQVVFREVRAAGPEYEPRRARESERYTGLLLRALELAHQQGLLAFPPDETIAFAITTSVEAVALRNLSSKNPRPVAESAEALISLAFRAFGARGPV